MYLKKVLSQPNLVGSVLIALMVCGGFVYTFVFDGFNIEIATGGEVEAWLAATTPETCKPNFNAKCTITDKYGNESTCEKYCGSIGKQKNRCRYCRSKKTKSRN